MAQGWAWVKLRAGVGSRMRFGNEPSAPHVLGRFTISHREGKGVGRPMGG